jgi:hypothetical protein
MFDSKQTLTTRLADATDLLIDFATLGEYGLEPVGSTRQGCDGLRHRPMPIADRTSFDEVLFPNQCNSRTRGSGPKLSRKRGRRGASMAASAGGAA